MPDPITTTLELNLPPSLNRPRLISEPGAFVRVTQRPDGTLLFVAPAPNPFGKIAKAFGQLKRAIGMALVPAFRQVQQMAMDMERTMAQINALLKVPQHLRDEANTLPRIAGLQGRYFVRAGLDTRYREPQQLAHLVRIILAGDTDYDPDLALVTRENLILIAVSAMRSWEQRGERLTSWWCGDRCGEGEAVGMQASCSPAIRWRCEHYHPVEPPLIAHRQWGSTRVEVHCG